jgi:polyphosphate kinase
MNSLIDRKMIAILYRASQAGVKVDLLVRGMCSLRPGIPGVSDNIKVTSIVGRFLEHSRIYWFRNGGDEEVLVGSADLMPRNLNRRVEILFPVEDPAVVRRLRDDILEVYLRDNVKARYMQADGSYVHARPADGEEPLDSQAWFIEHAADRVAPGAAGLAASQAPLTGRALGRTPCRSSSCATDPRVRRPSGRVPTPSDR